MARDGDERQPDKQLPHIDDPFVLDTASGLYKRKSEIGTRGSNYDDAQRDLRVSVRRDWVTVWLAIATLGVVLLYTYYSKRTVDVMKESEERVSIRLGDDKITLNSPPAFIRIRSFDLDHPKGVDGSAMEVNFPLVLENVGNRIATRYSVWSNLIADTKGPAMAPWGKWWETACQTASGNMHGNSVPILWKPLFRGVVHLDETASIDFVPSATQRISEVYIVACVTYRELNGDERFSAVMYCQSDLIGKPKQVLSDPDMFYAPNMKFWACNHAE